MTKIDFAHWLEKKYLEWQQKQGGRRTAGEFAKWLGFENMTVNHWLNGKHTPTHGNAYILSFRLGLEVYDVLGFPRPDEGLYQVQTHWHTLKDEERAAIKRVIDRAKKREGNGEA